MKGDKGENGIVGPRGMKGVSGKIGARGPPGLEGKRGEKGEGESLRVRISIIYYTQVFDKSIIFIV